MNFCSVRDLCSGSDSLWAGLASGNDVALTNNGKPFALIIGIPEGCFDETLQAVRQAKAMIALNSIRRKAARAGYLSDDDINALAADAETEGWEECSG
ncbi:MAG: prevent-host-death protein [Clostridia bacterium]|nr:prevent-host-death protein [Clostridia bacterium]